MGKRFAIVAAGPLFNFVLAIIAYWLMFMLGVTGLKPIVGEVSPDSAMGRSGVETRDEIIRVGDRETPTWQIASLELLNQALDTGVVAMEVSRHGRLVPVKLDLRDTRHLLSEGGLLEKLGVEPWRGPDDPVLGDLVEGGAAESAGLLTGDRILSLAGQPVETWTQWAQTVRAHPGKPLSVRLLRNGAEYERTLTPQAVEEKGEIIGRVGVFSGLKDIDTEFFATVRYNPWAGFQQALAETTRITALTLKVMGKLVLGQASVRNVSGPITIAEFAGSSASVGLSAFLGVLALFSISIGVLNLLPIPVLDGGHLMFYLVEWIKGSPVSAFVEAAGQRIGFAVLAGLITLALYNDIIRLMG